MAERAAGRYFAMGDSRDNSEDIRFLGAPGYIPAENPIGRAEFRLISMEPGARLWQMWAAMQVRRFFGAIH